MFHPLVMVCHEEMWILWGTLSFHLFINFLVQQKIKITKYHILMYNDNISRGHKKKSTLRLSKVFHQLYWITIDVKTQMQMFTFATQHKQNELQRRLNFKYSMVEKRRWWFAIAKTIEKWWCVRTTLGKEDLRKIWNKEKTSLGGPLGITSMNQKHTNHFLRPFTLNVFTTIYIYICMSIACTNIWLEVYFRIKKIDFFKNFVFLIKMALSKIDSLNFENS